MNKYNLLGTTDEVNSCDCCGRKNLKETVCFEVADTGELVYFGVVCAARMRNLKAQDIKEQIKQTAVENTNKALQFAQNHPLISEFHRLWSISNAVVRDFSKPASVFQNHPDRVAFRQVETSIQSDIDNAFPRQWRNSLKSVSCWY